MSIKKSGSVLSRIFLCPIIAFRKVENGKLLSKKMRTIFLTFDLCTFIVNIELQK